jgi:hypothetical protein
MSPCVTSLKTQVLDTPVPLEELQELFPAVPYSVAAS